MARREKRFFLNGSAHGDISLYFMVPLIMGRKLTSSFFENLDIPGVRAGSPSSRDKVRIFAAYIVIAAIVTTSLFTLQAVYILGVTPRPAMYVLPSAVAVLFGYLIGKIKLLNSRLRITALSDMLTGLSNRLCFQTKLTQEISRAKRYGSNLSLLLFDIDKFKIVNDTHGHQAGDCVLVELARTMLLIMRDSDICARWGGEEFVVMLVDTPLAGAHMAAERLRQAIEKCTFPGSGRLTCSFGVTEFHINDTDATLMARADTALYQAKQSGRNCVKAAA
jgi:diguanylate cyclase (GGDEF)-like protein